MQPLLQLLLVILVVPGAHVLVSNNEAANGKALGDDLHQVADRVLLAGLGVVLADHAAGDDAAEVVHGVDGGLELLAAHVLVVDVDAVGGEARERVGGLLGLVVEAGVEAELGGDEVELLVVADAADDGEAFMLGQLTDELADGARCGGDEDGLALLGHTDLVEGTPGCEAGHAQRAEEVLGVEVVWVLELLDLLDGLGVEYAVLLNWRDAACDEDIALLELVCVALHDLEDGAVGDGLAELEGRRVRLGLGSAHATTLVGIEGGVEVLDEKTASGELLVEVDIAGLDGEVLAWLGPALWHLLEDDTLVLNHIV